MSCPAHVKQQIQAKRPVVLYPRSSHKCVRELKIWQLFVNCYMYVDYIVSLYLKCKRAM